MSARFPSRRSAECPPSEDFLISASVGYGNTNDLSPGEVDLNSEPAMYYPIQPRRRRGRPRKVEMTREPPADIFWRNGRAYGNFRAWAAWGGKREPLVVAGERFATTQPNTAAILFAQRLQALRTLRRFHPNGLAGDELQSISAYSEYHINELAEGEGRRRPTVRYIENLRFRLKVAAEFFASRGTKLLRQLSGQDVHAFMLYLRTFVPRHPTLKRERLSTTTQRQYMDALGHMLQRAASEGRVAVELGRARPTRRAHGR